MHSNRHHFKEGSWLLARKLESFTRHSWMFLSFGDKTFHHIHCACHKTNCHFFHNVVLPWTKKKNHFRDSRWEERCSIVWYHARWLTINARQTSRTESQMTLPCADRSLSQDRTKCSSHRNSRGWFFFFVQGSFSPPLRLVAHRLPHTAPSVFTLSSWIQRSIQSIILFPRIWKLQNSIFLGRSWQKMCMYYPRRWEHADSMYSWSSFQLSSVPQWQRSASAKHSGTRSWRHGSGCGILHWQIYTIVRPRDGKCVRARTQ